MTEPSTTNLPDLTVSELAASLKRTIETNFDHVRVRGELGRVTIARSGHMYADIKDEKAVLNSVMWKGQVNALSFRPEEGLEVVAEGKLSIYAGRSNYQLIASSMRPAGAGALMALLEERKKKFTAEGLFSSEHKKRLPFLPTTIGVVTSPTGAVIRDILHRVEDRYPVRVILWPALVQGDLAAEQITAAINGFNEMTGANRPDVLIVGRGGGSIEDLWPFNEENVVRAAFASDIPLISAVGHETDTTLIDYVSDARAPTPTGAAEIAVPVRSELLGSVDEYGSRLRRSLLSRVANLKDRLRAARLPRADAILTPKRQRFDFAEAGLKRALQTAINRKSLELTRISTRLRPEALPQDLKRRKERLREIAIRARPALLRLHARLADRLSAHGKLLETLSYQATLKRGFTVVRTSDGSIIRSASAARKHEAVQVSFADGDVGAQIDQSDLKAEAPKKAKHQK
ncbi:MAG: exodeoxyribonuclease VII large subunit, partial [Pseudomonadota bacterium]